MKKFFKFAIAAIAAVTITTVLVSAAVAGNATENIELSSKSYPALDCSMAVSQAETIFGLLPDQIKEQCRSEYAKLSTKCRNTSSYVYQGVRISTSRKNGTVSICFTYGDYTVKVNNTTWERLDRLFGQE